jgi:hypothetical protein
MQSDEARMTTVMLARLVNRIESSWKSFNGYKRKVIKYDSIQRYGRDEEEKYMV